MAILAAVGVGAATAFCVAEGVQRGIRWYLDSLFKRSIQPLQEQYVKISQQKPDTFYLPVNEYHSSWSDVKCYCNPDCYGEEGKDTPCSLKAQEIRKAYSDFWDTSSRLSSLDNQEIFMVAALVLVVVSAIFAVSVAAPVGASVALKIGLGIGAGLSAGTITLFSVLSRIPGCCSVDD